LAAKALKDNFKALAKLLKAAENRHSGQATRPGIQDFQAILDSGFRRSDRLLQEALLKKS
jgi:hypothetical protein